MSAAPVGPAHPVFVDVDTGVDDAMALAYLFASPEADLVGIASTAGNVGVHEVCRNNLALLELCGITGVPVSTGSEIPLSAPLRRLRPWRRPRDFFILTHRRDRAWPPLSVRLTFTAAPRAPRSPHALCH